jgi:hypothetical protein
MDLQAGYFEHPQNWFPAFAPFFAVRRTIPAPQAGQTFWQT